MLGARSYVASIAYNYWGTTSTTLIDKAIYDYTDNFNLGKILYLPLLATPPESTYPFVANVTLTTDGAITDVVGVEPVTFTVTFNRDMDQDVQPQVSFGPAEPYTDHMIEGGWTNSRTWTGNFNVTPTTGDGWQLIRVAGAVAADDAWLVTGNDFGRFRFEIITSGSSAMNLQASGSEGKVHLWWSQTDFDTLAGYNLYRSTSPSSGFSRLNSTIIPRGLAEWDDTNVTPGQPYYYYFTVAETDFFESDPSATVTATPTDTIPPVLSHTPITAAPPGQPLSLTATATDNVGVQSVTLFYRPLGGSYASRAMVKTTGNSYAATLEGSLITAPGIEYYLEASDGISRARSGSDTNPHPVQVADKPILTTVTPASGPADGGTRVTLSGSNFKDGLNVSFGGAACGDLTRASGTQLSCTTPAHYPAVVDVTVTNPDNKSATLLRGFTYIGNTVSLGLPATNGRQNASVTIPINAANVQGLASADLTLSYDPAVLTINAVNTGSLTPGWTLVANTATAGQVKIAMISGGGNVSGAGILANLEFTIAGSPGATSALTLSGVSLNGGAIPAETSAGSVTVDAVFSVAGTLSYWTAARPVAGIDLSLSGERLYTGASGADGTYLISNVPGGNYTLTPSGGSADNGISALDASKVLRHAAGLESLTGNALRAADVDQSGAVNAFDAFHILQRAVGLIDLPFPGAGQVWRFDPAQRTYTVLGASQTGQHFTAILLGDPTGNWAGDAEASGAESQDLGDGVAAGQSTDNPNASLALPSATIPSGEQATLPLTLDLTAGSCQAADLEIHYDPAVVSVTQVSPGAAVTGWQIATNLQTPGVIRASLAGATPLTSGAGQELLRLNLQAQGAAGTSTALSLARGELDETPGTLSDGQASIAAPRFTLSVGKAGTGTGTVTSSPAGIDCGSDCDEKYSSGTLVTLSATPAADATFAGWSGGGCSGTGTCQVTLTSAKSVTATFTLKTQTLKVTKSGTGKGTVTSSPAGISCGNTCAKAFPQGTQVNLSATPYTGSAFAGWSGACTGTGACQVTLGSAQSVAARFVPLTLRISDASLSEGHSGTQDLTFTVSLSGVSAGTVKVDYATANGTASAGSDFTTTKGTLSFTPGVTQQTLRVPVKGDTTLEANETLYVNLSRPSGASLADKQGLGLIRNDDGPALSIADASLSEGQSGTQVMTFTVTLSAPSATAVSVDYATQDRTATVDSDYLEANDTLTIPAGATSGTISVVIRGDTLAEANELFTLVLTRPSTNAYIADGEALGTLINDDSPALSISDASLTEGHSGTQMMTFTVTLNAPSASPVYVDYSTDDDTAAMDSDYLEATDTLSFPPGVTSQTLDVPVLGDTLPELNETFVVRLSRPVNATLADDQGLGTIVNDD